MPYPIQNENECFLHPMPAPWFSGHIVRFPEISEAMGKYLVVLFAGDSNVGAAATSKSNECGSKRL